MAEAALLDVVLTEQASVALTVNLLTVGEA